MSAIHVQQAIGPKTADLDVEIVERKGIGLPIRCATASWRRWDGP
jgi:S-adenosylmethionine synthetase